MILPRLRMLVDVACPACGEVLHAVTWLEPSRLSADAYVGQVVVEMDEAGRAHLRSHGPATAQ